MISVFWIFAALLVAAAVLMLALPLWRARPEAADETSVDALGVLRDQKRELDRDVEAGRITPEERDERIAELSRRVVEEGLTTEEGEVRTSEAREARPRSPRGLAIALAVLIPLVAFPAYWLVGTPASLDPALRTPLAQDGRGGHNDITPERFRAMLAELRTRLDANPNDVTGWRMLAGGLRYVGDLQGSVDALARAAAVAPDDAAVLADYADVLALANNRDLTGKPWELIQKALQLDPKLPKALALAGSAELARGHNDAAKGYWERLLALLPPDSSDAKEVRTILAHLGASPASADATTAARADAQPSSAVAKPSSADAKPSNAGAKPSSADANASTAKPGAMPVANAGIEGTVSLAPSLAGTAKPDDVLFIVARRADGPRMPLAVERRKVSELPLKFRLDDTKSMPGGAPLSSATAVKIEARIAKAGDAITKSGDLRGEAPVVGPGASHVAIVIDHVVP